jgi:hypothetical protein
LSWFCGRSLLNSRPWCLEVDVNNLGKFIDPRLIEDHGLELALWNSSIGSYLREHMPELLVKL